MLKNTIRLKKYFLLAAMLLALSMSACGHDKKKEESQGSINEIVLNDENKEEPGKDEENTEDDDDDEDDTLQKPAEELRINVKAAVVGDCTGIGLAPIMGWGENDKNNEKYELFVAGTADEAAESLRSGQSDIAILPLMTAVKLFEEDKNVSVLATNTYNNIYVATLDDTITEKANLAGQTVVYCEDSSLTSSVAKRVIESCGATAQAADSNEAIKNGLIDGSITLAVVPEPYITLAKLSNDAVEMGPDVKELWSGIDESDIISSVLVARRNFADENKDSMNYIIDDFRQSVNTVIHGVSKTLEWSSQFNIVTDKSLAVSSMKNCNYTFTSGSEMRAAVKKFLKSNSDVVPEGVIDDDGFYFIG